MASTTSPSLLMRVRNANDQAAWQEFVELYSPVVRSYCYQRRIQEADISDIVQDVMSTLANAMRDFQYDTSKGRFRAWFGTVAANKIKSFLAKDARHHRVPADEVDLSEAYADPDSDWIAIFSERVFEVACSRIRSQFADPTWRSFEATWIHKQEASEVALELGIPTHSVYVNKSRVLKRLEVEVRTLVDDIPYPDARTP